MRLIHVPGRLALLLLVCSVLLASAACVSTPTPAPPTAVAPAAETPTPIVIVVTATPAPATATSTAAASTATNTAVAPTPSATQAPPAPTATAKPTSTLVPPTAAPPKPSPTPPCTQLMVGGFGKVWSENQSARDYVGCPVSPEKGVDFTAQRFENGVIFFTSATDYFGKDAILVLFRDNGTWSKLSVPADAAPSAIGAPPAGKFAPAGRIGWLWQNGAGVRTRLGWALAPEKSGKYGDPSNGAWQAFSRGYMYWIPWAPPDDRSIYVVATYNLYPPGGNRTDWLEFKDTWAP